MKGSSSYGESMQIAYTIDPHVSFESVMAKLEHNQKYQPSYSLQCLEIPLRSNLASTLQEMRIVLWAPSVIRISSASRYPGQQK